jgi:hypothetical protein
VYACGEQERHRHRIQNSDKSQSEQTDGTLKVGGRHTDQLCEVSYRANIDLGAPALGVNLGFLNLQAGEELDLALALRNDVGALAALLVGDRHRTDGAAKPGRFLNGRVDLGDAPIEVGDGLALDREAGIGIGSPVRKR